MRAYTVIKPFLNVVDDNLNRSSFLISFNFNTQLRTQFEVIIRMHDTYTKQLIVVTEHAVIQPLKNVQYH